MSESSFPDITAQCPHCGYEQVISEFMVRAARGFGLEGVVCRDCSEQIPAEAIEEAMRDG